MKKTTLSLCSLLFVSAVFSQGPSASENQKTLQSTAASGRSDTLPPGFQKTADGLSYKVIGEAKGDKIVPGNVLRIHVTSRLGDSLLATSYGRGPQAVPVPTDGPNLNMFTMFFDAHKGDSILLLQPVDSILAKNPMAAADSFLLANRGKSIETVMKIADVFKDQETLTAGQVAMDEAAIEAYLKSKHIQTKRSPKGVYVQTIKPGIGVKPKAGQTVSLRYKGRLLNGQEFDSNTKPGSPLLPVTLGAGSVIPGLEDGVAQLSKGEKAVLYIPSSLGYGSQAPPVIGPDQNLVFEIQVVSIATKVPAKK